MRVMLGVAAVIVAAALPGTALAEPRTITGTDGADVLKGTAAADLIDGKAGADRIDGAAGRDVIRCGAGRDKVVAERQDEVSGDCETVTYRRSLTDEVADSPLEQHAAHDQQHSEPGGHLPGSSENVELVGQLDIEGAAAGRVADVSAYGDYAYLTVRDPEGCSDAGVAVVDISDPTDPVQVGFIDATEGSFPGEGSQVVNLRTPSFRGQVLVFNNEICALGGEGGVSLWDVTDPENPTPLSEHAGDADPGGFVSQFNQIHSAFAWQQGRRAFAVIVDNEEFTDVDILEITDPTNPELLTELDLAALFDIEQEELATRGNFQSVNLHDMVVQRVRGTWTMLLSYWDAGWVLLDVDDPANPQFISDSDYPFPDSLFPDVEFPEGNAHQAEFSPGGRFIIGTDEDFSPYRLTHDSLKVTVRYERRRLPGRRVRLDGPDPGLPGPGDRGTDVLRRARLPVQRAVRSAGPDTQCLDARGRRGRGEDRRPVARGVLLLREGGAGAARGLRRGGDRQPSRGSRRRSGSGRVAVRQPGARVHADDRGGLHRAQGVPPALRADARLHRSGSC